MSGCYTSVHARTCSPTVSSSALDFQLAKVVAGAGAIPHLAALISHTDAKLKRQVCSCLSQISKHNVDLAESVVESNVVAPYALSPLSPRAARCTRHSLVHGVARKL